jgi:hypothetical protein
VNAVKQVQPSGDALRLIDARTWLDGVSARQRELFGKTTEKRRNCVIGKSGTVHAVVEAKWLGVAEVLVPACHVGISGFDLTRMRATHKYVSCGRAACVAAAKTAHRSAPSMGGEKPLPLPDNWVEGQYELVLDLTA